MPKTKQDFNASNSGMRPERGVLAVIFAGHDGLALNRPTQERHKNASIHVDSLKHYTVTDLLTTAGHYSRQVYSFFTV